MKVTSYNPIDGMGNVNPIRKRELARAYHVIDLDSGETLIDLRLYMGRAANSSTVYALVWIHDAANHGPWGQGQGSAGGYGYDKESAAAATALQCAGVELDTNIHGVGPSAVREALEALAVHLGAARVKIMESYP